MKASHLTEEQLLELMALADGELEGADRERAEKLVAEDEDARRVIESMRRPDVGAWLQESTDARATAAGADAIADLVMARLASGDGVEGVRPPAASQDGVVRIADARKRRPRSSRLELVIGGGVAALALAAGVALYVHSSDATREEAPVASVRVPPVDTPSNGVELDEIDAPQRGVSVFEIPASAAAAMAEPAHGSSIVVWVDEEPGSK